MTACGAARTQAPSNPEPLLVLAQAHLDMAEALAAGQEAAARLAAATPLPVPLLRRVFEGKGQPWKADYEDPVFIDCWQVDWANFVSEYPDVELGDSKEWSERLRGALRLVPG